MSEESHPYHVESLGELQEETLGIRSGEELKVFRELVEDREELLQFGYWNWNPVTDGLIWSKGMFMLMDFDSIPDVPEVTMAYYRSHIVAEDQVTIMGAYERARSDKDKMVEYRHTVLTNRRNKKIFHSRGRLVYNNLGDIKCVIGITCDVTERTRLLDDLYHYKAMMEREVFLGHGSWEWNLTDKSAIWSVGMYHLFGYDFQKDNKPNLPAPGDLYRVHLSPDDFEKARTNLKKVLKNGVGEYVWNYEITCPDGTKKMLESFGKIVRDKSGRGLKVLGTTRDVTQLRKYEQELQQKVIELDRLSKELEDSAYAASHDLQEPLRKISTLTDRLQDKFKEVLPEDGKNYIERIQLATRNARLLIDSLLEFSRITHETQTFKEIDLNLILLEVKADLELKIEETQTKISSGSLPDLVGSFLLIKQLFSNILLNSIKFRKADAFPVIDIQSRALDKNEIEDYQLTPGIAYFLIAIKDNGIGFEEEYATKIFQMFSRLHGKSEYPGAGIGLALCKKIVENHKGLIFATSVPGEGATFSVILPQKHT